MKTSMYKTLYMCLLIVILFCSALLFISTCRAVELSDGDSRYKEFHGYRDYRAYKDEFRSSKPDIARESVVIIHLEPNDMLQYGGTDMSMHYPRECIGDITYNECMEVWNQRDHYVWAKVIQEFQENAGSK